MATKWDFINETERQALDATPCELDCSGCGEHLTTEGDFARHFVLRSRTYLNLGDCPKKGVKA